ncbi:hypothetical protein ACFWF0_32715, partial [Nocardia asteroides]
RQIEEVHVRGRPGDRHGIAQRHVARLAHLDSLLQAGQYVQLLEQRQGERIACVEEIALRMGFIGPEQCQALGRELGDSGYGRYVQETARRTPARAPEPAVGFTAA